MCAETQFTASSGTLLCFPVTRQTAYRRVGELVVPTRSDYDLPPSATPVRFQEPASARRPSSTISTSGNASCHHCPTNLLADYSDLTPAFS